ncbi:MAG: TIGR02285 family protein [Desulforhopalus sp.]|jgi:uncharacterized protein (TIGR02285 family)|nr:TIGR02285 family protein [Desulforhopalus sp.]
MRLLLRPIVIVCLLATQLLASGISRGEEQITWLEAVAPPFFIHDGPFRGEGYQDQLTEILKEHLPQYRHRHLQANISRHYQQWRQGEKACSIGMYRTLEREEFAYFSIPSVFSLPPVLIIHRDRLADFGDPKSVSLKEILISGKLVIGRPDNRSYGIICDAILDAYGNEHNIFSYEGPELATNLFKMLQAGRIDALPGLPEEAMYLAEQMGIREEIITLPIAEHQNSHDASLSAVACSKTPWGKTAIAAINKVLLEQRPKERYRAAYERWLDPQSIAEYRRLYDEVFLSTSQ